MLKTDDLPIAAAASSHASSQAALAIAESSAASSPPWREVERHSRRRKWAVVEAVSRQQPEE